MPGRSAWAGDPHHEVAEGVIKLRDVGKHAHARMLRRAGEGVYSVVADLLTCMESISYVSCVRPRA